MIPRNEHPRRDERERRAERLEHQQHRRDDECVIATITSGNTKTSSCST